MSLTEQQQERAIARARQALAAEHSGDLPPGMPTSDASAYWRGWLRQALTTLIEDLTDDEGGES